METAKLECLVSKLLREGAARKEDGVQPLMNVLLARHVEYQRKPQSVRARRPRPSAELRLACDRLSLAQALKKSLRDALREIACRSFTFGSIEPIAGAPPPVPTTIIMRAGTYCAVVPPEMYANAS